MTLQQVKQRFGIIGHSSSLNRAIEKAMQVAPTDMSVLISGESGTGKEMFPQIIHHLSQRKHNAYIAVNCGAIPEGTIDSELFGHEKGSFTGAVKSRKGYFEEADKGTIFLDEVGELPIATQVRLLRVLETGEFIKVGSSQVTKTDVRVIVATNVNMQKAVSEGRFREDLYYRLNTVPIFIPPLRERKEDIHLLFRKFTQDFSEKYRTPDIILSDSARRELENFRWNGNVRQLKNIAEQISVIEEERTISGETIKKYLPEDAEQMLPALYKNSNPGKDFCDEREILYQILFDMRKEINELKLIVQNTSVEKHKSPISVNDTFFPGESIIEKTPKANFEIKSHYTQTRNEPFEPEIEDTEEIKEESLSLKDTEIHLIQKALKKNKGKRKYAAKDLGISERTLYRKLKEYDINI